MSSTEDRSHISITLCLAMRSTKERQKQAHQLREINGEKKTLKEKCEELDEGGQGALTERNRGEGTDEVRGVMSIGGIKGLLHQTNANCKTDTNHLNHVAESEFVGLN